jgi:transposase-like protein
MANKILKARAQEMRIKSEMSYSQIKEIIGVSKSTLHYWLRDYPLSEERIKELGPNSERRIERFRDTMAGKQKVKSDIAYKKVSKDIKRLSKREMFLCGLFLYWAEGAKTMNSSTMLTNTNPKMLKFFIKWLDLLNISKDKLKVFLHLYSDMNINKEINFWAKGLQIPKSQFRKPYIKKTLFTNITYKNGFGHGTCSILYGNKPIHDYVMMGVKRIQDLFD